MSDEVILGIIGAVGAMVGNIVVIWRSEQATKKATKAVAENTEATGSQQKITVDLASKAEENYQMMKNVLAEFRVESQADREAAFDRAVGHVWRTREQVLLARHVETMGFMRAIWARLGGDPGAFPPAGGAAQGMELPPLNQPIEGEKPEPG